MFTDYFTSLMHTLLFRRSIPMQHAVAEKRSPLSSHHRNERCFSEHKAANTNVLHTIGSGCFEVVSSTRQKKKGITATRHIMNFFNQH